MICSTCKADTVGQPGMFGVLMCTNCGATLDTKDTLSFMDDLSPTETVKATSGKTAKVVAAVNIENVLKASGFEIGVKVKVRKEFYRIHSDKLNKVFTISDIIIKDLGKENTPKKVIILYFDETGVHDPYIYYHFIKV